MPKHIKARIFPGSTEVVHIPDNIEKEEALRIHEKRKNSTEEQIMWLLELVQTFGTPESRALKKKLLEELGWKETPEGWRKGEVFLNQDKAFDIDRTAKTIDMHFAAMCALLHEINKAPIAALPAINAAFIAGGVFTEYKAYELLTKGRGPKPIEAEVFAALDEAQTILRAKAKNKINVKAAALHPYYDKVREKHGAPAMSSGTFANWVCQWRKLRS